MGASSVTAGPWQWDIDENGRGRITGPGSVSIADLYQPPFGSMEANACLIAAAPDLATMLKRVSRLNSFRELNDLLPEVRAAIAKAEAT